jgi:hypothetical protein
MTKDSLHEELSINESEPMRILAVFVPVGVSVDAELGYAGTPCFLSTMLLEEGITL